MGANILVVDDESGPRESLRMILNLEHDVRMAASGREALELVSENAPDLVFLDIRMPEMDGTEVLRRIKELAPDVEVAMITAYAAVQSAQRAMRLGALDYITKPFGVAEVEAVVERALEKRREEREGRLLMEQLNNTITQLSEQLGTARPTIEENNEALARNLASAHSSIEDQLNEVLRLSSIGEVASEVAHDLNNFLSTILFRIEIMLLDVDQSHRMDTQTLVDGLQQIALAARDGGEALERLSALSRSNPYEPVEKVDLNEILQASVELSQGRIDHNDEAYELSFDLEDLPRIDGSPAGLRTVFTNLIINAYHALSSRAGAHQIRVRSYREGPMVVAQVTDDGIGMSDEVKARLSEPFFTTKGEGGTGLGLTVAHKVIAQHHGAIEFDSKPGIGTTVTVRLPITQCGDEVAEEADELTVLVVDDQAGLLTITQEVLQSQGFQVMMASSAEEALRFFEPGEHGLPAQPPRVLVTDLRMPGMLGSELATRVKQLAPETRVIILSAFLEETDAESLDAADLVLGKPFDLRELGRIIGELVNSEVARR